MDEFLSLAMTDRDARRSGAFVCMFCAQDLNLYDQHARQVHYEEHLSEPGPSALPPSSLQRAQLNSQVDMGIFSQSGKEKSTQDVFWNSSSDAQPPPNHSPGLIPLLRSQLTSSHEKGYTRRAVVCFDQAVHITHESFDRGWGCGYRNFTMACAALVAQPVQPEYFGLLTGSSRPGVRNLQETVERAWAAGFDPEGAAQLKHKLRGTSKWIGTAELHVAFSYLGIPSRLADFALPRTNTKPLLDWIREYFDPAQPGTSANPWKGARAVIPSDKMPLVLQHDGHSRTVVGYEITKNGQTNLLVFDPATRIREPIRAAGLARWTASPTKEPLSQKANSRSSRLSNSVKHPLDAMKKAKRVRSPEQSPAPVKRQRAGQRDVIELDSDGDVVPARETGAIRQIGGRAMPSAADEAELLAQRHVQRTGATDAQPSLPSTADVLKIFRLDNRRLASHSKYQVLWFPLTDPLSEHDKSILREVHSEKIC
ncbi:DUF1671-domain-containing protein [Peniophora sp. CONT]|nr:DUF1671-domain-containing protein [Peniophora sp. CONT]